MVTVDLSILPVVIQNIVRNISRRCCNSIFWETKSCGIGLIEDGFEKSSILSQISQEISPKLIQTLSLKTRNILSTNTSQNLNHFRVAIRALGFLVK